MQARQIAIARRALGWTQARLAAEAGLHQKSVVYWERQGTVEPHRFHTGGGLYRIKAVLDRQGVTFGPDHVTISNP
jgi:transcriptional regulator with XRE-family HTH domain